MTRLNAEVRAMARRFAEAEEREEERPAAVLGYGHWLASRVNDAGIPRLACVVHTCGLTWRRVPSNEFLTFYWGPYNEITLGRRARTTIELGLVVWISVPRFGPREWWTVLPIACSFRLCGNMVGMFGRWLGVLGNITLGARYVGSRATGLETMVLHSSFRVWAVRSSPPDNIPEAFNESTLFGHRVDFGAVEPYIRWVQEARDDVSVTGVNLYICRFRPCSSSSDGTPSSPSEP